MANAFDFDFLDGLIEESPPIYTHRNIIAKPPINVNNSSIEKSSRNHPYKVAIKPIKPSKIDNNQHEANRQEYQESTVSRVSPRTNNNSHLSPRGKRHLVNPAIKSNNVTVKTKVPSNVGKDENRVKFNKMSVQQREAYVALQKFKCIPGVITEPSQLKLDDSKQYDASSGYFTSYETSAIRESRRENYIINELQKKLNWMSEVDYARQSIESNRKYQLKMAKLKEIQEKEKEKQILIEKALLTAKYQVLDASLDNSPIKAIENEVITTLEKGLSRQHLDSNMMQTVFNPNISESSPQVDEGSYQSTSSAINTFQVGSSYIERQQKAKSYGRVQAGGEMNKNIKKTPAVPAKYQHLFKSSAPTDKYHANIKKPDGKYPNYLPQHHSKRDDRSVTNEGYAYAYQHVNNLDEISKRYNNNVVNHAQHVVPQNDPNNDGDAYFLDDGMEIDGESTVSHLVFTEWGEDPVYDGEDNLPEDAGVHANTDNYIASDGEDDDPQDSRGNENVWKDYYYEDHEGNVVLDLSNRFDAVEIPQYMAADEGARNHVNDVHNNYGFYNDLDKFNSASPQSPYQDFPDEEDYEYSNEYEDSKQYDEDLLTSAEENEVFFYNDGRSLDKYDYALDISGSHEVDAPLNTSDGGSGLAMRADTADKEYGTATNENTTIDTSIGAISSPGTDVAVAAVEAAHEYVDDFEEFATDSNVASPIADYHVNTRTDDDIVDNAVVGEGVVEQASFQVEHNANTNKVTESAQEQTLMSTHTAESAATKLQSQIRMNQSKKRVNEMRKEKVAAGTKGVSKEVVVSTHTAESAATKLQSQIRMNQSKKRVNEMRKEKVAAGTKGVSKEVVVSTHTAESAATKLQSQIRMNQSKKRVNEMRKEKAVASTTEMRDPPKVAAINVDEDTAATKLQSQIRMNQSKKRVNAMMKEKAAVNTADSAAPTEEVKTVLPSQGDRNAGMDLIKAAKQKQQSQQSVPAKPKKDVPKRTGSNAHTASKQSDARNMPQKAAALPVRGATKPVKTVKNYISNPIITEANAAAVTTTASSNEVSPSVDSDELKKKKDLALARLKKKKMNINVENVPELCIET